MCTCLWNQNDVFKFAFPGKFLQTNRNVRTYHYHFWQTCQFAKYFLIFFWNYFSLIFLHFFSDIFPRYFCNLFFANLVDLFFQYFFWQNRQIYFFVNFVNFFFANFVNLFFLEEIHYFFHSLKSLQIKVKHFYKLTGMSGTHITTFNKLAYLQLIVCYSLQFIFLSIL